MALLTEAQSAISIHAPREGGDVHRKRVDLLADISIHAPREGGDPLSPSGSWTNCGFQSTPPARGATAAGMTPTQIQAISIHAPREGGDA